MAVLQLLLTLTLKTDKQIYYNLYVLYMPQAFNMNQSQIHKYKKSKGFLINCAKQLFLKFFYRLTELTKKKDNYHFIILLLY